MRAAGRLRTGDLHRGEVALLPPELQPHGALPRCRPGRNAHTKGERTPIRRASFREPGASTLGGTRTRNHMVLNHARLPVCGTSAKEPPPGADPGHPPYEGGAAAVRGGEATLPGFEPGTSWFRAKRCCRLS